MKILELLGQRIFGFFRSKLTEKVDNRSKVKAKCPKCNEEVNLGMERCPKCYTKIEELFYIECPRCREKVSVKKNSCEKCGYDFFQEARRETIYKCPICGYEAKYYMLSCPACGTRFTS